MTFSKILIANRGEIACRVMRTARDLGYATVAVFSDADRQALHVRMADEAVYIGGSEAKDSYLNISAILQAAQQSGADAVHPGYGFLSENAGFAQACLDTGLVFIGPTPQAMLAMGDKARAKQRMLLAGVPCAPGFMEPNADDAVLLTQGIALGFPLLVKATAGGGGRGMRHVTSQEDLPSAIESARREALSAFGNGDLMLERLIDNGRHIEIQVFADQHGNAVYLGERDCTAQRRRQKVIEETPSPIVSPAMRERMGRDAVAAALAVAYQGAGTVEFIVDADLNHYFLEMNTRLQVEHTVTEMVTGLDLVEWQLRVAAGEPLPLKQVDIRFEGHAIQARLYAEDPYAGFVPQTGKIRWWKPLAALHVGVRIDHGVHEGDVISPFYDPMVAKVIAHGRDRDDAIRRLRAALRNAPLLGLRNNNRFLSDLLNHPTFRKAQMTTTLIDQWASDGDPLLEKPQPSSKAWQVAALALVAQHGSSWRSDSVAAFGMQLHCESETRFLRVLPDAHGAVLIEMLSQAQSSDPLPIRAQVHSFDQGTLRFSMEGVVQSAVAWVSGLEVHLALDSHQFVFSEHNAMAQKLAVQDPGKAHATVAGKVTRVLVAVGDTVSEGQQLLCVEAMKMEMWLCAQVAGSVLALHAEPGQQIDAGALLVEIS
jgi:geranyl-CoA carboxylase alpha subunit